jgi:elongator complex protein 3 (tRNA carboxymethyluridine synthase)
MKKLARTISGVTPVAVMTRPQGCPGNCVYCPNYEVTPRSYTPASPAVLRARRCNFDAATQVQTRLDMLARMGHPTDKVELIIMGGTFLASPEDYQYGFVKDCYDAMNGAVSDSLAEAVSRNETARFRCVGLCVETRPDFCGPEEVRRMLDFGITRIELGVQTLDDDIFRIVRRGHGVAAVVSATKLLKDYGFKVHYHWMPGLPGMNPERDLELFKTVFSDERFRPDGMKLYPVMVVAGTELEKWYRDGNYQPYTDNVMIDLMAAMKAEVPPYVRLSRVLRDIPPQYIVGGLKNSVRDVVKKRMRAAGKECRCIRCREHGHRQRDGWEIGEPSMKRLDYPAQGGDEIFLSLEDDKETLFGLLRLRVQSYPIGEVDKTGDVPAAIVRELHVYGAEVPLNNQEDSAAQHKGLGRKLVAEAERIAAEEFGVGQIAVLSGVGAREYYRNLGYELIDGYMVKGL